MGENKNFEEQNKLPELKLGKIINVFVFFFLRGWEMIWFLEIFVSDAKQAQGFLSFFKTLPHVSPN